MKCLLVLRMVRESEGVFMFLMGAAFFDLFYDDRAEVISNVNGLTTVGVRGSALSS